MQGQDHQKRQSDHKDDCHGKASYEYLVRRNDMNESGRNKIHRELVKYMIRSWSNPHLLYLQDIGKQAEEINKQTEEIPTYLSSLLWMFISSYHHHVKISS